MERAKAGTMCPHCGREPLHQIDARLPFDAYLICGICDSTYNIDVPVEFDPKDRLIVELRAEIERLKDRHGSTMCICGHQVNSHFDSLQPTHSIHHTKEPLCGL